LFPTLTKLCHTKHDHPANFLHFSRTLTAKFPYRANDVIIDVISNMFVDIIKVFIFISDLATDNDQQSYQRLEHIM